MNRGLGFFETLRISIFDFKSYLKFANMSSINVFLNRVLFVFLISIFYILFLNKDIKFINDFNNTKHEIFEDINFSNNILNIKNSPRIFESDNFILIGDTREDFNLGEFQNYSNYGSSLVLLKDSFIIKNGNNKFEMKYSDISALSLITLNGGLDKDGIFELIELGISYFKYSIYIILPIVMIFNFFLLALITSFFGFACSIIARFRMKFIQVYRMILFAQGLPFFIISVFEIIAKFNGVKFVFPSHILEFLTLSVFLISLFSIRYDAMKKILKK